MFSPEINYLVNQEKHKDRLRKTEQNRLLDTISLTQNTGWSQKMAGRLGNWMVLWGAKLEKYAAVSPSKRMTLNT